MRERVRHREAAAIIHAAEYQDVAVVVGCHDNIARVFYVGEDRGVHYIVFEFIEGVNIRDLVDQQGPLPLNQALSYTYQIALALDHASQSSSS